MREQKKRIFKKAAVLGLSVLMAFGPSLTYVSTAKAADLSTADSYFIDEDGNATDSEGNAVDLDSILNGMENGEEVDSENDIISNAQSVSFESAVEYVYVEKTMVGGGETQNVVVGTTDSMQEHGIIASSLELVNVDDGSVVTVVSSNNADGAFLFAHEFEDGQAGSYTLQNITFECEDGSYVTDIASAELTSVSVDEDENLDVNGEVQSMDTEVTASGVAHYGFDVVRADTAAALREAEEMSEDDNVSALTVSEDGELVAASSVEEAIANSGAEPENIVDAEESIDVTQEEFDVLAEEALVEQEATTPDETGAIADTTEANIEDGNESVNSDVIESAIVEESAPAAEVLDSEGVIVGEYGDNPIVVFFSNVWQGVCGLFTAIFAPTTAYAAVSSAPEGYLVVAIDPGHGGSDSGATGNGLYEKNLTLSISNYMKSKLDGYTGVTTYMTRTGDTYVGLQERVDNAVAKGADVFVSVHINSGGGYGVEVYVPNNSSYLKNEVAVPGQELGKKVLNNLVSLGFTNRGTKSDVYDNNGSKLYYADGSRADAFAVIRYSRAAGIPGILVEAGFIDNSSDAAKLTQTSYLKSIGEGIANGVISQYGLVTSSSAKSAALVGTTANVANIGWLNQVYDQKVAGTTGKSFALYGLQVQLLNAAASAGGVQYRVNNGSGWQSWVSNGATAGSTGGTPLQAIQISLTGNASSKYDIYYRVHVANIGWMGWAKNGESAGTSGYGNRVEAVQVTVVSKGSAAPGSTSSAYMEKTATSSPTVAYTAHYQNRGWLSEVSDGASAGTAGSGLRLEALQARIGNSVGGGIELRAHVQNIGWQSWTTGTAGTSDQSKRIEAIQARLTGEMANQYDLYYRVYVQGTGWMGWAKNGESAGSQGYSLRIESIQMQLVKKGGSAPSGSGSAFKYVEVSYQTHVQNIGWQSAATNGGTAGTSGRSLRLEAMKISLGGAITEQYSGSIQYRTHIQNIGWQDWVSNGALAGTSGRSLRMEAVQIKLTGDVANYYDVYYRAHVQNIGWQDWVKNGETAGTTGQSKRVEAIEIKLVKKTTTTTTTTVSNPLTLSAPTASSTVVTKGSTVTWKNNVSGDATGATYVYLYRRGTTGTTTRTSTAKLTASQAGMYQVAVEATQNGKTTTSAWTTVQVTSESIMGSSKVTKAKMKTYWAKIFADRGYTYPAVYAELGAATLDEFIDKAYEQAEKEGVRADVLLAQIALETKWLQFGGDVKAEQCNFGGIGATGNGVSGNTFDDVSTGLLVNVQHLQAYATSKDVALKTAQVDPRYGYVTRNSAPYVEQLAGKWASDLDYGIKIDDILNAFYA